MDGFNDLNVFVQVARVRSFVEAGRRLGISASAVGKTIARLEHHFGARLFHRTTRSISLTEDGARLLVRCERILEELEGAELDFARGDEIPRGRLRITLPMASRSSRPCSRSSRAPTRTSNSTSSSVTYWSTWSAMDSTWPFARGCRPTLGSRRESSPRFAT